MSMNDNLQIAHISVLKYQKEGLHIAKVWSSSTFTVEADIAKVKENWYEIEVGEKNVLEWPP